ncbi:hypothetical protein VIGAN_04130000, partial [Vigna angularis var. angularis]
TNFQSISLFCFPASHETKAPTSIYNRRPRTRQLLDTSSVTLATTENFMDATSANEEHVTSHLLHEIELPRGSPKLLRPHDFFIMMVHMSFVPCKTCLILI